MNINKGNDVNESQLFFQLFRETHLTKYLDEYMDEILDLNGNKISQMKDYLTEEQYRFVRSGNRFDELEGKKELLFNFNEMLKDLKRRIMVESSSQSIKNLEKELTIYKKKQKDYEKDLEKLKLKIKIKYNVNH